MPILVASICGAFRLYLYLMSAILSWNLLKLCFGEQTLAEGYLSAGQASQAGHGQDGGIGAIILLSALGFLTGSMTDLTLTLCEIPGATLLWVVFRARGIELSETGHQSLADM